MSYRKKQAKSTIVLLNAYKDYLEGMGWIHLAGFEDETYKDVVIWASVIALLKEYQQTNQVSIDRLNEYYVDEDCIELAVSLFNIGKNLIKRGTTLKI
jgi:hypothetical protein